MGPLTSTQRAGEAVVIAIAAGLIGAAAWCGFVIYVLLRLFFAIWREA